MVCSLKLFASSWSVSACHKGCTARQIALVGPACCFQEFVAAVNALSSGASASAAAEAMYIKTRVASAHLRTFGCSLFEILFEAAGTSEHTVCATG